MSAERPELLAFQIDLARQMERPERLETWLEGMVDFGYRLCVLYLEDAFAYPRHPGLARENALSVAAARRLAEKGLELVPVIPALGHCAWITSKKGYERYDEGRGTDALHGTLSPSFPETYDLVRELFEDWCLNVPGNYLHAGLDESPSMGQYHLRTRGPETFDGPAMFAEHVRKLNAIAKSLGRRLVIWGDMLYYYPECVAALDKDIIVADWYYYPFDRFPCVEVYNFEEKDSASPLVKAGFEVWGCPAVWPNFPFPNVRERWKNLVSWTRYGWEVNYELRITNYELGKEKKGFTRLLLTDWENATGFYGVTDLLFRAFAKTREEVSPEKSLAENEKNALPEALATSLGLDPKHPIVASLFLLGNYHLTGHANRSMVLRGNLSSMLTSSPERKSEYAGKAAAVNALFDGLADTIAKTPSGLARERLLDIEQAWRFVSAFWNAAAALNALRDNALTNPGELADIADKLDRFADAYAARWNAVRYPNDPKPAFDWARRGAAELRAIRDPKAFFDAPRLELVVRCDRPALPVLDMSLEWPDGAPQPAREILIRFEAAYAAPNISWRQYPVIPIERDTAPEKISLQVARYGQMTVEDLFVSNGPNRTRYRLETTSGPNARAQNGALIIGPVRAYPGDPTRRPAPDKAVYAKT